MRAHTGGIILAILATGAVAGSDPASVPARQQAMKDMAAAAKSIAGMFESRLPYDQRQFRNAAATIARHAGKTLVVQFPAGTLGPPSQATPEIAARPQEFVALADHLRRYAEALFWAADRAPDAITPAMRMRADTGGGSNSLLGRRARSEGDPDVLPAEHVFHLMLQDCTGCHALYRKKP